MFSGSTKEDTNVQKAKRIGGLAIAAVIATASLAPTSAEARGGRFAGGALAGFAAGALFGAAIGGWGALSLLLRLSGAGLLPSSV